MARPAPDSRPARHTCPLAVSLNTFPTGTLKTPYYYQYNFGIEQKLNAHGAVRIGYVGTRGLHEPFQVGLNGYQTVCAGCFAPYPYAQPLDQRFGSVNEFRTDASSNYSGLQTSLSEQLHSLTLSANYTFSHCLDEVSNGGLLPFSTQGILTPLPGELSRQYSNCDYDVRHNLSAYGIYQIPFASKHLLLRALFRNWSFSETAFLHSGLPFSVLSQPYTANGNGVFQANGPQFARRVSGQPLYQKTACPRRHRCRNKAMAQSQRLRLRRRSHHRRLHRSAIHPPTASLATPAATPCAARTSLTPTSTCRAGFLCGNRPLCASMCRCSTPSTIPTSHCPAVWRLAYPENTFRRSSEPWRAPSHRQPAS